jgi:hypothetical protein
MHPNCLQMKKGEMWHARCSNSLGHLTSSRRATVQVWTAIAYSSLGGINEPDVRPALGQRARSAVLSGPLLHMLMSAVCT